LPDSWIVAIANCNRGKSGLRKDTVPVNGWRRWLQGQCHRK